MTQLCTSTLGSFDDMPPNPSKKDFLEAKLRLLNTRLESPDLDPEDRKKKTAQVQIIRDALQYTSSEGLLTPIIKNLVTTYTVADSDDESGPIFQGPDESEVLENGVQLYTFWNEHSKSLAFSAGVDSNDVLIGKDEKGYFWEVLLRGSEEDFETKYLEQIPVEFADMRVLVHFTSTVEQSLEQGDIICAVPSGNRFSTGYIATDLTATAPYHAIVSRNGREFCTVAADDVEGHVMRARKGLDTATMQLTVGAIPSRNAIRTGICGERVFKAASNFSNISHGVVKSSCTTKLRITQVDSACVPGDSGMCWQAESDFCIVGIHLRGHSNLSNDSVDAAPVNDITFPNLQIS